MEIRTHDHRAGSATVTPAKNGELKLNIEKLTGKTFWVH